MENARKIALGFTLFFAIIAGIRVYLIHRERVEAEHPAAAPETAHYKISDDDIVQLRQLYPSSMKDAKTLVGKSIWVNAGGQIQAYPYKGHISFAQPDSYLLGADELQVKDFIIAAAPSSASIRIPRGNRQVYVVFTRPSDPAKQLAAPIGYVDESGYTFYLDTMFFYDDPHTLYKWPQPVWDAISRHEAIPGMDERQAGLALGQISSSNTMDLGNRTVKYFNLGKSVAVTFEHNKATTIQPTQF